MQYRPFKPAPDLFLHAAATIGVEPAACAVVEDTPSGVQAAVAAGMRAIGYSADSDERALSEAGAEPLSSLDELPQLLGQDEGLAASRGKPARTVGRPPLTVAVAQPRCRPKDVSANALSHASLIRSARARVIVFPELSLTGYELDAEPVSPGEEALLSIVEACAEANSVALVSGPVASVDGRLHIGTLRIGPDGIEVAYRKCYLGDEEPVRFAPGDGPAVFDLDGWRIGLGICKDTGVERHILATADLDIDLYAVGLVHLPSELAMQESRAVRVARACAAHVAFASFAGPTGGGFDRTAGVSSIWSADGTALARAGSQPGELTRATLS